MKKRPWSDYFYSEVHLVCCAIAIRDESGTEFIGSAVYLAPGLFVTAKHVIEHPLNKIGISKTIYENKKFGQVDGNYSSDKFRIEAVQLLKTEDKIAQRWSIEKMHFSHDFDLAIITASSTDGPITDLIDDLPTISVNIHPMPFKNNVTSYGFYGKSTHTNDAVGTDNHNLTFTGRAGNLISFHLDTASVAGSAVYEVDNKIEHMMSGGPTVNHEGSVIGINSAGLEVDDKNLGGRTIVTPFMRAMFMDFDFWTDGAWQKTSLYKLAAAGMIEVIGYEHLTQNGEHIVWSPNPSCEYCNRGLEYHKG